MKVLACTGGIGSGKSYVSALFNKTGVPVYYSDDRAKALYSHPSVIEKVCAYFGDGIYGPDLRLNRSELAARVFTDPEALAFLESVLYPALLEDFRQWASKSVNPSGFVILESAVILEKPLFRGLADRVLVVSAPLELRIERVMKRDGVSRRQVLERISNQAPQEKMEAEADFVIFADDFHALLPQIESVLDYFKE